MTAAAGPAPDPAPAAGTGARRDVLPYGLQILALTSFVVARPVFGSFGRSPETFVARGADWSDVVAFAVLLVLVPPALVVAADLALGRQWPAARPVVRWATIAVLSGLVVWQLVGHATDWATAIGVPMSLAAGVAVAWAWGRGDMVATFFRYASVGALAFLVEFLALAPVSSIVLGGRHGGIAPVAARSVAAALGEHPPPVVLVVFDGLPTELLLDGTGHIDAHLYPHIAALAGDGTWYRDNTTAAQFTLEAVPAILSGQRPDVDFRPAVAANYPHNLFTLLGGSYDLHVVEQVTALCPVSLCPETAGSPLPALTHDAAFIWKAQMTDAAVDPELVPNVSDRYARAQRWIAAQDFRPGDRPGLFVYHVMLPHPGWVYLPDGSTYRARGVGETPPGMVGDTWSDWGGDVGRQRHVLQIQAADRLVGELAARLRAAGTYDDSVVVMTADHGYAFAPGAPWRALDRRNVDQILWAPLIVKRPGQTRGVIDDRNVNSTDILPTIADAVGLSHLPWPTDGRVASRSHRDPGDKWVVDWAPARLRPRAGDDVVHVDGRALFAKVLASDPVEGTGKLAVWRRTAYGGLVDTRVADHPVRAASPAPTVRVEGLGQWDDVDRRRPPLELIGTSLLPGPGMVAVAVDGTVAAVVPTRPGAYGVSIVHALLWPGALRAGRDEVRLYTVDGTPAAPVLHPLAVTSQ